MVAKPFTNLTAPEGAGDEFMTQAATELAQAGSLVDPAIQSGALSGLAAEQTAASARRLNRADQLAADAGAMWAIALTTPTVYAGMGFRVAQQSGGYPASGGTGTGGPGT